MSEIPPTLVKGGGDVDRVVVSLRAAGEDLDPDELTRLLGVMPTFAARRGERHMVHGREVKQRMGVWSVRFTGAPQEWTLEDAIFRLLQRFPSDTNLWKSLAEKYELDLFCGVFMSSANRGFSLSPSILRQIAERELELGVDIYYIRNEEPMDG